MKTSAFLIAMGVTLAAGAARAQQPTGAPGDALARDPYITATGATVDKPGQPQSSGNTRQDLRIQKQNNKIDKEICKGC